MLDVNNFITLKKYLVDSEIIPAGNLVSIEPLTGGVSSSVLKISSDKGPFVLKQALPKLKVNSEWISDIERGNVEKDALKFLHKIIPGMCPGLIYEDEENCLFLMDCAPEPSVTWKSLLMQQNCNETIARKVGEILGEFHQVTHDLQEARELFANKKFFYQLRIEPFFEFLKWKYPGLTKDISQHILNCLQRESSLVIGDFSPKNILVHGDEVIIIDLEVIHYGDTSFDLGFLSVHLLLKSIKFPEVRKSYYNMLQQTIEGYFPHIRFARRADLEQWAVKHFAWILLARVDGKSPVEYITEQKDKKLIRLISGEILSSNMKTFRQVIEFIHLKTKYK